MPTYLFRCPHCLTSFEEKRSFASADTLAACPVCGSSETARIFTAPTFFSPGAAAKQMIDPKPVVPKIPSGHGAGCPCCRVRLG